MFENSHFWKIPVQRRVIQWAACELLLPTPFGAFYTHPECRATMKRPGYGFFRKFWSHQIPSEHVPKQPTRPDAHIISKRSLRLEHVFTLQLREPVTLEYLVNQESTRTIVTEENSSGREFHLSAVWLPSASPLQQQNLLHEPSDNLQLVESQSLHSHSLAHVCVQ